MRSLRPPAAGTQEAGRVLQALCVCETTSGPPRVVKKIFACR